METKQMKPILSEEERALSISKYYDLPFADLDPVRAQILEAGPIDPAAITPYDHLTDLIRLEGYVPGSDYGYCMLEDGSGFVATYNVFHNATMEMLKWWFPWMNTKASNQPEGCGNIKYKVWCPYGHFDHGLAVDPEGNTVPRAAEALDLLLDDDPVDNIYMLGSETHGSAACIHGSISAADYGYALSYLRSIACDNTSKEINAAVYSLQFFARASDP